MLVPRQIRSPPKSAAAASQLSSALGGTPSQPNSAGVGMPQIAIPPGINGDPHQLQQLLQLNQLLMQQQNMG